MAGTKEAICKPACKGPNFPFGHFNVLFAGSRPNLFYYEHKAVTPDFCLLNLLIPFFNSQSFFLTARGSDQSIINLHKPSDKIFIIFISPRNHPLLYLIKIPASMAQSHARQTCDQVTALIPARSSNILSWSF